VQRGIVGRVAKARGHGHLSDIMRSRGQLLKGARPCQSRRVGGRKSPCPMALVANNSAESAPVALVEHLLAVPAFKSLRSKATWTKETVCKVVDNMEQFIGEDACALIKSGKYAPGPVVKIGAGAGSEDDLELSVSQADCKAHYVLLKPVLQHFKDRVPSGFFLGDAFLELDQRLAGQLLKPYPTNAAKREVRALQEGGKLKKLIQYLRLLFRASDVSRDPVILELKALLAHKPKKIRHGNSDASERSTSPSKSTSAPSTPVSGSSDITDSLSSSPSDIRMLTMQILGLTEPHGAGDIPPTVLAVEYELAVCPPAAVLKQSKKEVRDIKCKAKAKSTGKAARRKGKATFKRTPKKRCNKIMQKSKCRMRGEQEGPTEQLACKRSAGGEQAAQPELQADSNLPEGALDHLQCDLPEDCLPQGRRNAKFSYTLKHVNGCSVDVLLKQKSFYVKRWPLLHKEEAMTQRNFSWNKYGSPAKAWQACKEACAWQ
jgi:hypothetical protein